ncbi:MAG: hypothetical protein IPO87_10770 [Flavobacteriales bacterium]|nr:hypothetical protein [Flavobacteriales bacterium]
MLGVVPVVRSIESGIPELVQHNSTGVLVNEDPNQASAALIALANDPERWARCSAGARALIATNYAAEHNYTNWVDQMAAMMESPQPAYPLRVGEIQLPAEGSLLGKGYKRKYIPPSLFRRVVNKSEASPGIATMTKDALTHKAGGYLESLDFL